MKITKVNRYQCDFCTKRGLSASHISKHEKRCTANPNRECGLCEGVAIELEPLIKRFSKFKIVDNPEFEINSNPFEIPEKLIKADFTLSDITESVDTCPACTLAILRQSGLSKFSVMSQFEYNYKKESIEYLREKHDYAPCIY